MDLGHQGHISEARTEKCCTTAAVLFNAGEMHIRDSRMITGRLSYFIWAPYSTQRSHIWREIHSNNKSFILEQTKLSLGTA